MDTPPLLLASRSPRRRRLIDWLGLPVQTTAVDTPEDLAVPLAAQPSLLAESIATEKALAARTHAREGQLVLACDTVVVLDGAVLGKPADEADARRMLHALSGRAHEVATGVALLAPGAARPRTFSVVTRVDMRRLDEAAIDAWLSTGEALGCAGAYNIEHHLASVTLDECYQNVAGLPLCHIRAALADGTLGGVSAGLLSPVRTCDAARGVRCALGRRLGAGAPTDAASER